MIIIIIQNEENLQNDCNHDSDFQRKGEKKLENDDFLTILIRKILGGFKLVPRGESNGGTTVRCSVRQST